MRGEPFPNHPPSPRVRVGPIRQALGQPALKAGAGSSFGDTLCEVGEGFFDLVHEDQREVARLQAFQR